MSLKETVLNSKNTHINITTIDGGLNRSCSQFLGRRVAPHTFIKQLKTFDKPKGNIITITITYM